MIIFQRYDEVISTMILEHDITDFDAVTMERERSNLPKPKSDAPGSGKIPKLTSAERDRCFKKKLCFYWYKCGTL
jgi:hypothetical protein